MKKILIYAGSGANNFCIKALIWALKVEKLDSIYELTLVDHNHFLGNQWQKETDLVIFPGGRDLPYHHALKGIGNSQLLEFVRLGGNFLGICAGGYYGCASVEFEKGGSLEIVQERELRFFPGIARGPAYGVGKFRYQSEKGAQIAQLNLFSPSSSFNRSSSAYYNGGCSFIKAEQYENVSILAQYTNIKDRPAAIVKCSVGTGIAILSGVHPEYSAFYSNAKNRFKKDIFLAMQKIENKRRVLFQTILNLLNVRISVSI